MLFEGRDLFFLFLKERGSYVFLEAREIGLLSLSRVPDVEYVFMELNRGLHVFWAYAWSTYVT